MKKSRLPLLSLAAVALATGCLSPSTPPEISYFGLQGRAERAPESTLARSPLRLRHVRAPSYIADRIVWRSSPVEVGFYDDRKWCEPPAQTIERALHHQLFSVQGFVPAEERAPAVDVEVTFFEEVVAPRHEARVTLVLALTDSGSRSLPEMEITETHPVRDDAPSSFALAMDAALDAAMARLGNAVATALGKPAPAAASSPPTE
jgi:uncharacterized lipoprotein YmbA